MSVRSRFSPVEVKARRAAARSCGHQTSVASVETALSAGLRTAERVPPAVERLVAWAARTVQPLAALTPVDARAERRRLVAAFRGGCPLEPRWTYAPVHHAELRSALDDAERWLVRADDPVGALYLARVRELSLEAALCSAAGSAEVAGIARQRFACTDAEVAQHASDTCDRWLTEPPAGEAPCGRVLSDAPDSRSLLSRMRRAVGERKLPFTVVVSEAIASLAATGRDVILVCAGRPVGEEDAARTVLHEVEGHAAPRARAREAALGIVRVGTARGTDDQEGLALVYEERAGLLGSRRRRQLALRHRAVEAMLGGATFADVAYLLVRGWGLEAEEAILMAERAFRGGDGSRPGLGRERVYIESFGRVRAHLAAHPEDEHVLSTGQVAVDAAPVVRGAS